MYTYFKLHFNGALGVLLMLASPAVAQVGLGLSPLRLELATKPGQTQTDSLLLSNESTTAVHIRATTLDFSIDDEQQPQFTVAGPGEDSHSCRNWLKLNPVEFDLAPQEHRLVRYSLRYPDQLNEGSFHCAAGFTTSPQPGEGALGMVTNVRMITTFYAVHGKPKPEAKVASMRFLPPDDVSAAKRKVVVQIENSGSTYFRVLGALEVNDEAGLVLETVPFPAIPVLPNRTQPFAVALKTDYAPGQMIRARVDVGSGEIQDVYVRATPAQPALH